MSEKRKRAGPVEEVFEENDLYKNLMEKSFDDADDLSDSEYSVSDAGEGEEFVGLASDEEEEVEGEEDEEEGEDEEVEGEEDEEVEGEEDDEEDEDEEEEEGDVEAQLRAMREKDGFDDDALVKAILNGVADDDDDEWEDVDDDDEDEDDDDDEDDEEDDSEEEETQKEQKNKNGRDSGIESEDQEKDEQAKKISVRQVLAQIRGGERDGEHLLEASTSKEEQEPKKPLFNEYEDDSSDEEDLRNTVGNIPLNWYDEYPHLGYDLEGKPITKPARGDTLDEFLNKTENPDYNRTVFDKQTGQDVRLSDADLELTHRVTANKVPDTAFDMYAPFVDLFSHEVRDMPVSGRPESKKSFIPSKAEAAWVSKRAVLLRQGRINYPRRGALKKKRRHYDIWAREGDDKIRRIVNPLRAPKTPLPGHGLSYRPPKEFLNKRVEAFSALRLVPGYKEYIKELHERCLDLYIAPRKRILKTKAKAQDLLPNIPKPKDLRPFPTREALRFEGHRSIIRTISVHPLGKYLASGSDDYTLKIWEVGTGRCLRSFSFHAAIKWVSWNPSPKLFLVAVALENLVYMVNPETYLTDKTVVRQTNDIFKVEPEQGEEQTSKAAKRLKNSVTWRKPDADEWALGIRVVVEHFKDVKQVVWHKQGDYFCSLMPEGQNRSLMIHQLSRWRSQVPFSRIKSRLQVVEFHPKMAFLFVVSQSHIRVYNLQRQKMVKKIQANSRWVSSIAVHPGGENFIVGTYDRKVNWFEMECTRRPLIQRFHKGAVRRVAFHRKYPLFASASDDGRIIVTHAMVYNDWITDPLIVPVKELRGHRFLNDLYVLDIAWHPYEAFMFSAGADGQIIMWH